MIDSTVADRWQPCRGCRALVLVEQVRAGHGSCPDCGALTRLGAQERIAFLADPGSFAELDADLTGGDPLGFTDRLPYAQRLDAARERTGLADSVSYGTATVAGVRVVLVAMDFAFLGGSMGTVAGEKVTRAAERALRDRCPLLVVAASGGARMQEGVLSLAQMAKTASAFQRLCEERVPTIGVITDPVYGGVAASFSALADVIVAESGARAGFAGPGVIAQTVREQLPAGFQTAEFLLAHGHIDLVVRRNELPDTLRTLLRATEKPKIQSRKDGVDNPRHKAPRAEETEVWQRVELARHPDRPTVLDYLDRTFDEFLELHGDRWSGDDAAIVGGLARLGGRPVLVVGTCKGSSTEERVRRNFGMAHPAGYRKAVRLYRLAARWRLPLVTVIDTAGAYPGVRAEQENQSGAIAEALAALSTLPVPVLSVITGEGGSGGALALAVADTLLMQENAVLSVISPEGASTILFGEAGHAKQAARALGITAADQLDNGIADDIVPEPPGGAHTDPAAAARLLGERLATWLDRLCALPADELSARRRSRWREVGSAATTERGAQ
ncbi:acetyl-CoA carboxylase carboxyl transferase subunit alpha [Solihabitans fulvus]|uniref:Multifunctional fusion protein n=1 Tax=Solihabitans fulvus TaxID=1892852 RepID=A0A5B2XG40_9PSEU|nr:acetyl-CoA carboxylase carboxyl transferase subunit alpha [Solihabitans fulvus]